ncbi:MAG TPA: peptide chain release factor 1 [Deltaproteobacteria bacterium]|nr:peptide chain release factor 1 [Deltaproteobacteria bacterium]HPR53927.1 peptide chain release factor 1 [Deltaproteobacteria bacterium]HXK46727.1 peptide chain release factor 1 [Deltaproteobacteria bacterium]
MLERLKEIEDRYEKLSGLLADPEVLKDPAQYTNFAREQSSLEEFMVPYARLKQVLAAIEENEAMLEDPDPEIRSLVKDELTALRDEKDRIETQLKALFIPKDPNDARDVILEIRAGTGGDEAALFASDLFRMYSRYAEEKRWAVEVLSINETGIGGIKEVIAGIKGKGAYSRLKYESGVHRVQRVPATEASGRIHTSAVTVAVLPEAEEVDVEIDPNDLRIDTFRASGAGGQHVNKTESAIRITHIPTGIVVSCQDEKSQHKNKAKALRVIRTRILQKRQEDQDREIASQRRSQVGSGDRSERIRTYNFPQGRVTDHRINLTLHRLPLILEGDIDELVDELSAHYQAEALKKTGS